MHALTATSPASYRAALAAHPRLLVDYQKDHCPGCRMLAVSLQRFAGTAAAADLVLLEVRLETVGETLFRELGLRQTPTLSLFLDGQEVQRLAGFQSPQQIAQAVECTMGHASA